MLFFSDIKNIRCYPTFLEATIYRNKDLSKSSISYTINDVNFIFRQVIFFEHTVLAHDQSTDNHVFQQFLSVASQYFH